MALTGTCHYPQLDCAEYTLSNSSVIIIISNIIIVVVIIIIFFEDLTYFIDKNANY